MAALDDFGASQVYASLSEQRRSNIGPGTDVYSYLFAFPLSVRGHLIMCNVQADA